MSGAPPSAYGKSSLWLRNRLMLNKHNTKGRYQPGFEDSSVGQSHNVRTEWGQVQPLTDLGRTEAYDFETVVRNGEIAPHPGWLRQDPRGNVQPLWLNSDVVRGRLQQQYEYDFLTPHGGVEDVLLFRNQNTWAAPGDAFTIPTVRPPLIK